MFKILFKISSLIIFLLCFQQVQPTSIFNAHHTATKSLSPTNHLQSIIESKPSSLDAPISKNEFNSVESEDNGFQKAENVNELPNFDSSDKFFNKLVEKLYDGFYVFRNEYKNLENKLDEVLRKMQNYEEDFNTKNSTDHLRVHDAHLNCLQNCTTFENKTGVCSNANKDGAFVFRIPSSDLKPFYAYCRRLDDQSTWTVIQRRDDGSINFNRDWYDYKHGFGDVYGEYWIGLERLHALTKFQDYELRVHLEDFDGSTGYARYSRFFVASEDEGYRLSLGAYSGDVGDSLGKHNHLKFTTYDRDNGTGNRNCAQYFKGGWWYSNCYYCNPNGIYFSFSNKNTFGGIKWNNWKSYSLRRVIMSIRPL